MDFLQEAKQRATKPVPPEQDEVSDVPQDTGEELVYVLSPDQAAHVQRLRRIAVYSSIMRDSSETGLGKTITYFELANVLGLKLVVLCPASLVEPTIAKWRMFANAPQDFEAYSYDKLVSEQLLINRGARTGLQPTNKFKSFVKQGVLLVCDEYHFAKNISAARAVNIRKLIRYTVEEVMKSYELQDADPSYPTIPSQVLVCSATQMDKDEQALGFLMNLGYVDGPLIKNGNPKEYMKLLDTCVVLCEQIKDFSAMRNAEEKLGVTLLTATNYPVRPGAVEKDKVNAIMYELTSTVIFSTITSEMEPFIPRLAFNAFFDFHRKQDDQLFEAGLKNLAGHTEEGLVGIVEGVQMTQRACIWESVRFLSLFLKKYPTSKVCLAASYVEAVLKPAKIAFENRGYKNILLLTASTTSGKNSKQRIINLFQNDDKYRILLMTTSLGVGIDLHDLSPNGRPRISLILRDFSPISAHQMAGRFFRRNMYTFGPCYVFNSLKYGPAYNHITQLINKKSAVLKSVTKDVFSGEMTRSFPGTYPRCIVGGSITGKDGEVQNILYIDERRLMERNKGQPLSDAGLIYRYINNKKLAFVDKPLWYIEEEQTAANDDYPSARLKPVDDSFRGLKGIYWLNKNIEKGLTTNYIPKIGMYPDNIYDIAVVEKKTRQFEAIIAEKKRDIYLALKAKGPEKFDSESGSYSSNSSQEIDSDEEDESFDEDEEPVGEEPLGEDEEPLGEGFD